MPLSVIKGDVEFQDTVSFGGSVGLPAGSVTNAGFSSATGDRLAYEKIEHYSQHNYQQAAGADVASQTAYLFLANGAAEITHVTIRPMTAPTGGDKQYTVDIQKAADASGSWSSVLSAVVTISSADTSNTNQSATVSSATVAAGSSLRVVITASGSTGSQGQGLLVAVGIAEQPS